MELTDEGLVSQVLRHPIARGKKGFRVSSLGFREEEELRSAYSLIKRAIKGEDNNNNKTLFLPVAAANIPQTLNPNYYSQTLNPKHSCNTQIIAHLSNGQLLPDDIIVDCTYKP